MVRVCTVVLVGLMMITVRRISVIVVVVVVGIVHSGSGGRVCSSGSKVGTNCGEPPADHHQNRSEHTKHKNEELFVFCFHDDQTFEVLPVDGRRVPKGRT